VILSRKEKGSKGKTIMFFPFLLDLCRPFGGGLPSPPPNEKDHPYGWSFSCLVEARGVEPLSESTSTTLSPGADGNLHSLLRTSAVKDPDSVASLVPGAGKAYCTHVRY